MNIKISSVGAIFIFLLIGVTGYHVASFCLINTATILRLEVHPETDQVIRLYPWDRDRKTYDKRNSTFVKILQGDERYMIEKDIPPGSITKFRIDPKNEDSSLSLYSISFANNYFPLVTYTADDILSHFTLYHLSVSEKGQDFIRLKATGSSPFLYLTTDPTLNARYYLAGICLILSFLGYFRRLIVPQRIRFHLWRNLDVLIAIGGILCGVLIFYPGGMSGDSIGQWRQVLHPEKINNWHPVAMVHLWKIVNYINHGPQGVLVFHYVAFFSALLIFGRLYISPLLPRALYIFVIGFFPVLFFMVGAIWKDVSMMGTVALSYGLLFNFRRSGNIWLLSFSLLLMFYGVSVRHNAIFCAIPYAIYLSYRIDQSPAIISHCKRGIISICILCALLLSSKIYSQVFVPEQNRAYHVENSIFLWDLWGMSLEAGESVFPDYALASDWKNISLEEMKHYYRPYTNSIVFSKILSDSRWTKRFPDKRFKRDLVFTIIEHPVAYAKVRLRLMSYMLNHTTLYGHYLFGIQKLRPGHYLWEYSNSLSSRHPTFLYWAKYMTMKLFDNTIIFKVWFYLALGLLQCACIWYYRKKSAFYYTEGIALLTSGLLYWFPYLFLSTSNDFRYSIYMIFSCLAVLPITVEIIYNRIVERFHIR